MGRSVSRHDALKSPCDDTESPKKASLETLPTELVIQILLNIGDLYTLDSVIRASPNVFRVFEYRGCEIIETVLDSSNLCGHVRVIICIVALLRSGTLPITSLQQFRRAVPVEAMRYRIRSSKKGLAPQHLAPDTSPAVIRSLLRTARAIEYYAIECLEAYLARFRALRPQHPVDQTLAFRDRNYRRCHDLIWSSRPDGRAVETKDVGPPSWSEEQRVVRAFWRLQLICDLKRAARKGTLNWSPECLAEVSRSDAVSQLPKPSDGPHHVHMWRNDLTDFYPWAWRSDNALVEVREIISVVNYIRDVYGEDSAERLRRGEPCPEQFSKSAIEVRRPWPSPKPMDKEWKTFIRASVAVMFHYGYYHDSHLASTDFDNVAYYGFAYWSSERMEAYGLFPKTANQWVNYRCTYAWLSVVNSEGHEITEV